MATQTRQARQRQQIKQTEQARQVTSMSTAPSARDSQGRQHSQGRRRRGRKGTGVVRKLIAVALLLVSLGLFAYPAVMSVLDAWHQDEVITTVVSVADETNDDERLRYLAQAKRHNMELAMSAGMTWFDDSEGNGGNAGTKRDVIHDPSLDAPTGDTTNFSNPDTTDVTANPESTADADITDAASPGVATDSPADRLPTPTETVAPDGSRQIEVSSSIEVNAYYEGIHDDAMRRYADISTSLGNEMPYGSQLSWRTPDVMGVIEIPSIGTRLTIRHGTTEESLASGAGHLETSSLPVGGFSSHCVISGHSGVETARMFDDIRLLQVGDVFLLKVLDDTYAYRVSSVEDMVDPDELADHVRIEEGRDLCTLFTCTPYGVNSHRLLVHGERIPYDPESEEIVWNATRVYVNDLTRPLIVAIFVAVATWVAVLAVAVVRRIVAGRRR